MSVGFVNASKALCLSLSICEFIITSTLSPLEAPPSHALDSFLWQVPAYTLK